MKETQLVYVTGTMEWLLNYGARLGHYHHQDRGTSIAKQVFLKEGGHICFNLQRHLVPIGRIMVLIFPSYRHSFIQKARLKTFKINMRHFLFKNKSASNALYLKMCHHLKYYLA